MSNRKWLTTAEIAQKEAERKRRERSEMIEAARNYARADRTDPFAMARMTAHIDSGLASYRRPGGRESGFDVEQGAAYYKATPYREQRKIAGSDGKVLLQDVVRYMNVARP